MMSQPGQQTIAIHTLPSISRSKGNHAIKFGQLIKHNVRDIFLKIHATNEVGRLVPDLFLFFLKTLNKVKTNDQHLAFHIFW